VAAETVLSTKSLLRLKLFILSPERVRTHAVVEREGHRSQERVVGFVAYLCNALSSPK
jgi:hypothetical protein